MCTVGIDEIHEHILRSAVADNALVLLNTAGGRCDLWSLVVMSSCDAQDGDTEHSPPCSYAHLQMLGDRRGNCLGNGGNAELP